MNLLILTPSLSRGGAEKALYQLASDLVNDDQIKKLWVVNLGQIDDYHHLLLKNGVRVTSLGLSARQPVASLKEFLAFIVHVFKFKPTHIHTWLYHSDLLGLFFKMAWFGKVKLMWGIRCSDVDWKEQRWTTQKIVKFLSFFSAVPDAIFHNSHLGRKAHEKIGYRSRRWKWIGNAIDTARFNLRSFDQDPARIQPRKKLNIEPHEFLISMAARYDSTKDFDTLMSVINLVLNEEPQVRFLLMGKGVDRKNEALVSLNRPEVRLMGEVENVQDYYAVSDAFLLTSKTEGSPNAVLEAMSVGIPGVVTDVGDLNSIAPLASWVVPRQSPEIMARRIHQLIHLPLADRMELGLKMRKWIELHHSMSAVHAEYLSSYLLLQN